MIVTYRLDVLILVLSQISVRVVDIIDLADGLYARRAKSMYRTSE